ncbi:MAG: phosphatase PAP2 family protein [Gordonia sp. (in: high G+C Gram-positive bacteria)]|uniref:phosphatase PAP2 family protein n=1 Tax=Gordonia sp. (in: high G+C Gram-positive bacteria) TaxID=84139 RepID=UPI0039E229CC
MSVAHIATPPPIDNGMLHLVIGGRSGFWTSVSNALSWLGSTTVLTVIVVIATVIFLAFRQWRTTLMLLLGSISAYWLMRVLKHLFDRDRPPVEDRLAHAAFQSMPSGHAMMSTIVFGLIAVGLYRSSTWIRQHPDVLMLAPILTGAIGLSRVYLGVHWMTDVVVGWLFGVLWVALFAGLASVGADRTRATAAAA